MAEITAAQLALQSVPWHGAEAGGAAQTPFASHLAEAVEAVVQPQAAAAEAVQAFAAGADGELHRTMLTVEKADIALKFLVSLRNRALEAYREIIHMDRG